MNKEQWWEIQKRKAMEYAEKDKNEVVIKYSPESIKQYFVRGATLLLGEAKGQWVNDLKFMGNSITLVDFPEVIEKLKEKKGRCEGCTLVGSNLDLNPPKFDKKFDLIIIDNVLEHLLYDFKCVENIYSWLKDGGRVIAIVPFHEVTEYDKFHLRSYNLLELKKLFTVAGFKILKLKMVPKGNLIVCTKG